MIWQGVLFVVGYLLLGTVFLALTIHFAKAADSQVAQFLFLILWPIWAAMVFLAVVFGGLIRLARWMAGEAKA